MESEGREGVRCDYKGISFKMLGNTGNEAHFEWKIILFRADWV